MLAPFGKYLLDEEIARGGMARVYLARLRGLGGFEKTLVVKQILPDLARDPRFVQMFVDEAKTLVRMTHPNIVPVYELGIVDGVYFLAMEHIEGATLAEILPSGPLTPAEAAHIGLHVCDALHYAHQKFGVVHRDVTPRNVIIDGEGHARLLDFGIAAPVESVVPPALEESLKEGRTSVFGSYGYMSPEQARGRSLGPATDVFSLGAVLYESITGKAAFLRASVEATAEALLDGPRPTLRGRDGVTDDFAAIVDDMMRLAPEERPDAASAGKRLRGFLASAQPEGVAPEVGARVIATRSRLKRPHNDSSEIDEDREPSHVVRTLATSPVLDAMLEGTGEIATGAIDRPVARAAQVPEHTTGAVRTSAIERAPAKREEPEEDSSVVRTVAIPRVSSPPAAPAEIASDIDDAEPTTVSIRLSEPPKAKPSEESDAHTQTPARQRDARPAALRESTQGHDGSTEPRRKLLLPMLGLALIAVVASVGVPWIGSLDEAATVEPRTSLPTASNRQGQIERAPQHPAHVADPGHEDPPVEPVAPTPPEPRRTPELTTPQVTRTEHPERTPSVEPRATGTLTINALPWADVSLDGRAFGHTPRRNVTVPAGSHTIELSCPPLGRSHRMTTRVVAGASQRIVVNLQTDPPTVTQQ